jgi:putative ABC transport system substrate-binding protein
MAWSEADPVSRASVAAFAKALERFGWAEGKNIVIDYRFAAGNPDLFKSYAAELIALSPDVILASTPPAVVSVQQRTHTIPIIFVLVVDPVQQGFVDNLARPGGNLTGFTSYDPPLMGKWLELLKEIAPDITRVAVIFNPDTSATYAPRFNSVIAAAGASLGVKVTFAPVRDDIAIENSIADQASGPGGALIGLPDPFIVTHRQVIIADAARYRLPLISVDFFPRSGGLMSYWFDPIALYSEAAPYVDRVLRGTMPADLPVQHPTKFSLVINLKTARALGLTVPQSILARADEVIE